MTHAAITENKRLEAVLEHIKAEQEKAAPKTRRAGKQKMRYQPTGKRNDGWNSKLARRVKTGRDNAITTRRITATSRLTTPPILGLSGLLSLAPVSAFGDNSERRLHLISCY